MLFIQIILKKNIFIGYIKDFASDKQKKNLDKLFRYSTTNQNSISFSQKKLTDGEKFIVKIKNVDSISKAIEVISEISN